MPDRLDRLLRLRDAIDAEIAKALAYERRRREHAERQRTRRNEPPCGTEAGYQWHRYRKQLPLPDGDPCGCAEAHRAHNRRQSLLAKSRTDAA